MTPPLTTPAPTTYPDAVVAGARAWLPIESAPKDGTRLRLGHEKEPGFGKKDPDGMCAVVGDWDGKQWRLSAYFIIPGGRYGLMATAPTHWMPLPQPRTTGDAA